MNVFRWTIFMTIMGTLSSGFGGYIGGKLNIKSNNTISSLYQLTAGMMTGIVCFDMLPECFLLTDVFFSCSGVIIGVFTVNLLDRIIEKKEQSKKNKKYSIMSLVVIISMAAHNILEGLAIGSGLSYSTSFGISLIISIFLHDIPEGMVVGITDSKKGIFRLTIDSALVGMSVGIGTFFGGIIGNISNSCISICLSIAAGAMLYIVACDLIPSSNKISNKKSSHVMYIVGILIGTLITKM